MNVENNRLNVESFSDSFESEVTITREQQVSNLYRVFIDKEIGNEQTYKNLISLLGSATEDDTFVFHLSSPGGQLEVGLQVYLALLNTRAHTVAQIDAYAASAATFFVMGAKQVLLSPHAFIMVHGATWGTGGHMQDVKRVVEFQHDRFLKILRDMYKGFLTEDEITQMVENQIDIYLGPEEIVERLKIREEQRQKDEEEELERMNKQFEELTIGEETPKKKNRRKNK